MYRWTLQYLLTKCASLPKPAAVIDIDEPQLMIPGNTIVKINAQLAKLGLPSFNLDNFEIPKLANLIFHSMAARYAEVLSLIRNITGKKLKRLFIVGGGNQNSLLNRLTAERTGLEIVLGSAESTTIGNFAIQLAALENPTTSTQGVTADAVARWAKRLANCIVNFQTDRGTV